MIIKETKYTYQDLAIMPASVSQIRHRSDCYLPDTLPIFTAPMTSVVGLDSKNVFEKNGIIPILPRPTELKERLNNNGWSAYSLKEFEENFLKEDLPINRKVLIDIANGHMAELYDLVSKVKELHSSAIEIMVGNIANPETYLIAEQAGVDYLRLGIGPGAGCFCKGVKILTNQGSKNIEDIVIGDSVLTHTGTYKKVTNIISYLDENKKIRINNRVICTPNHKFYVIEKADKDKVTDENIDSFAKWISAEELDKDRHLLVKCK